MLTETPWLSPAKLENITLPNRFVRSATELFAAGEDGHISPYELAAYEELKSEPIGTVITANTCVSPEGRSGKNQNAFWDESFFADQAAILKAARSGERKVIFQLGHGGIRAEGSNGGLPVYSPDNMTITVLQGIVEAFVRAAENAKALGFDGVQVHSAHSYLLSQMFYPQYNHRRDAYGGSVDNRLRMLLEIVAGIKISCGDEFPVFVKLNGTNAVENDQYILHVRRAAELMKREGVEALELSGYEPSPAGKVNAPYFFSRAACLAAETELPIILVGGIRKMKDVEDALAAGITAVSVSRPLLRDPDFFTHLLNGEDARCIGCNRCFGGADRREYRCVFRS